MGNYKTIKKNKNKKLSYRKQIACQHLSRSNSVLIIIIIRGYDLVRAVDSFVFSSYICGFALILSYKVSFFLVSTDRAAFADRVDPFVDSGDDLFSLF